MDLILSAYATLRLGQMNPGELMQYDLLLRQNDQDLYLWITGQAETPEELVPQIEDITLYVSNLR